MQDSEEADVSKTPAQITKEAEKRLFKRLYVNLKISIEKLSQAFGIVSRTGSRWLNENNTMTTGQDKY